jgi:hypothetical protein
MHLRLSGGGEIIIYVCNKQLRIGMALLLPVI